MASTDLRRYASLARLYGESAIDALQATHVVVLGVGGVGSWAAEALGRSAVGHLTLIDPDHVGESNLNRQVLALESTLGAAKVDVMAARLRDIDPQIQVHAIDQAADVNNLAQLVPGHTIVIDAVDSASVKAALIALCQARGQALLVCGAAGGRTQPQALRIADIALLKGDPLLATVRAKLRRDFGFSRDTGRAMGVMALHSTQAATGQQPGDQHTGAALNCAGYGSSVMVTASMGLAAAQWAVDQALALASQAQGGKRV